MDRKRKRADSCPTIQELLQFAIQREIEAAQGYADLARTAKTESLKSLLQELRSEEENHRRLLEDLEAGRAVPLLTGKIEDLRLSDYLIEEPLDAESSIQDLLVFAAKKEAKAVELYTRLLDGCSLPEQKRLFEFLIQQEQSHKLKLEKEYEAAILPEN